MDIRSILLIISSFAYVCDAQQYCYSTDPAPYRLYGTKTIYEARLKDAHAGKSSAVGCNPILIWHLNRHGARYPGEEDILAMNTTLMDIRRRLLNSSDYLLCPSDMDAIKNWTLRMVPEDDKKMVRTGERELFDIATRYRTRFPSLMNITYHGSNFKFRHTSKPRAEMSARFFAKGLFTSSTLFGTDLETLVDNIPMVVVPSDMDRVLRFYDNCEKYIKTVDDVPNVEVDRFDRSDVMANVLRNVSRRLGLSRELSFDEMEIVYASCIFEYGIYGVSRDNVPRGSNGSPWCAAFTASELEVMDYRKDLDDYYEAGYGHEINYQQTCPLVKDVFKWIRNATIDGGVNTPGAVLRFAHSATVTGLMTKIGLFKDANHLTADDFSKNTNRLFRDSRNVPMASNVAFTVFNCSGNFKFQLFVNEQEVLYPGCKDFMCEIDQLSFSLGTFADSCNFDEICKYIAPEGSTKPTSAGHELRVLREVVFFIALCSSLLFQAA